MEEPLKCPICGHDAILHDSYMMKDGHGYDAESYWYSCDHCGLIKPSKGANTIYCSDEKARADAAKYWNEEC